MECDKRSIFCLEVHTNIEWKGFLGINNKPVPFYLLHSLSLSEIMLLSNGKVFLREKKEKEINPLYLIHSLPLSEIMLLSNGKVSLGETRKRE